MRFLFVVLTAAVSFAVYAQSPSLPFQQAVQEGDTLRVQGTPESLGKAIAKYRDALAQSTQAGDTPAQAEALHRIGYAEFLLRENDAALQTYGRAAERARAAGVRRIEAQVAAGIAQVYANTGSRDKAILSYQEALRLWTALGDQRQQAETLHDIGVLYFAGNSYETALEYYGRALPLWKSAADRSGEAKTLNNIGWTYYSSNEVQKAIPYYEQALAIRRADSDKDLALQTTVNLGFAYDDLSRNQLALQYYSEALSLAHTLRNDQVEADLLTRAGRIHSSLGDKSQALVKYRDALTLWKSLNNVEGQMRCLIGLGAAHADLGNHANALASLDEALSLARTAHNARYQAAILSNTAYVYLNLHDKRKALDLLSQAHTFFAQAKDKSGEAHTLQAIGTVYIDLDDYGEAFRYLQQALALQEKTEPPDRSGQAYTLTSIAEGYAYLHDYGHARNDFQRALTLFQQLDDKRGQAFALSSLGQIALESEESTEAVQREQQAVEIWHELHDGRREARSLTDLAWAYSISGRDEQAVSTLRKSLDLARSAADSESEGRILNALGELAFFRNDLKQALIFFQQALPVREAALDRRGQARTLGNIGVVLEKTDRADAALDYYNRSIKVQESIRTRARIEEWKSRVADQAASVYARALSLNLRQGRPEAAFEISERARARSFVDQLGASRLQVHQGANSALIQEEQELRADLEDLDLEVRKGNSAPHADTGLKLSDTRSRQLALQGRYEEVLTNLKLSDPQYFSLRSSEPLTLAEVKNQLPAETSLVSYFFAMDKAYVFIITKNSFRAQELPSSGSQIAKQVKAFRDFADISEAHPFVLQELYRSLILPIRSYLKTAKICIVPHASLHYLPFGALSDGRRYLDEDFSFYYLPSASVIKFLRYDLRSGPQKLLALSFSSPEGLARLPFSDGNAARVAVLYDTKPLTGAAATRTALREHAPESDILFLSAHGRLDPVHPLFSNIVLAPQGKGESGLLQISDIYDLKLDRARLAVLSACDTQVREHSDGDDVVSFNRAFIYAGARTVVASLWSVADRQTSDLMLEFFQNLKQGAEAGDALRRAQRFVRATNPNPYYWAGFVLTGIPGSPSSSGTGLPK